MSDSQKPPWTITPEKVNLVVDRLVETGRPRKIILFGSYVCGETHADSDLDVLVVSDDEVENFVSPQSQSPGYAPSSCLARKRNRLQQNRNLFLQRP